MIKEFNWNNQYGIIQEQSVFDKIFKTKGSSNNAFAGFTFFQMLAGPFIGKKKAEEKSAYEKSVADWQQKFEQQTQKEIEAAVKRKDELKAAQNNLKNQHKMNQRTEAEKRKELQHQAQMELLNQQLKKLKNVEENIKSITNGPTTSEALSHMLEQSKQAYEDITPAQQQLVDNIGGVINKYCRDDEGKLLPASEWENALKDGEGKQAYNMIKDSPELKSMIETAQKKTAEYADNPDKLESALTDCLAGLDKGVRPSSEIEEELSNIDRVIREIDDIKQQVDESEKLKSQYEKQKESNKKAISDYEAAKTVEKSIDNLVSAGLSEKTDDGTKIYSVSSDNIKDVIQKDIDSLGLGSYNTDEERIDAIEEKRKDPQYKSTFERLDAAGIKSDQITTTFSFNDDQDAAKIADDFQKKLNSQVQKCVDLKSAAEEAKASNDELDSKISKADDDIKKCNDQIQDKLKNTSLPGNKDKYDEKDPHPQSTSDLKKYRETLNKQLEHNQASREMLDKSSKSVEKMVNSANSEKAAEDVINKLSEKEKQDLDQESYKFSQDEQKELEKRGYKFSSEGQITSVTVNETPEQTKARLESGVKSGDYVKVGDKYYKAEDVDENNNPKDGTTPAGPKKIEINKPNNNSDSEEHNKWTQLTNIAYATRDIGETPELPENADDAAKDKYAKDKYVYDKKQRDKAVAIKNLGGEEALAEKESEFLNDDYMNREDNDDWEDDVENDAAADDIDVEDDDDADGGDIETTETGEGDNKTTKKKLINPAKVWHKKKNKKTNKTTKNYYNKNDETISPEEYKEKVKRFQDLMKKKSQKKESLIQKQNNSFSFIKESWKPIQKSNTLNSFSITKLSKK